MSSEQVIVRPITIGNCLLGEVRSIQAPRAKFKLASKRSNEIEALVRWRDDQLWTSWIRPLADHLALRPVISGREITAPEIAHHIFVIAPWLVEHRDDLLETALRSLDEHVFWTATALGRHLNLSLHERADLKITTIRAVGQTASDQRATKRERDRVRQERRRREASAKPRDEWISESVAEEARRLGVSRKTIYARRKREDSAQCNSSVACKGDLIGRDAPVTFAPLIEQHAWLRAVAHDPERRDAVARVFGAAATILAPKRADRAA